MGNHKYPMNDSLWYCPSADHAVLNVFVNGFMNDDTEGGIPRYLVTCDTHIPDEELPIMESDLYRTELEAQDARYHKMLRKRDRQHRQLIETEKALALQKDLVERKRKQTSGWYDAVHGNAVMSGSYALVKVGCNGNLSLTSGASVSNLFVESGGCCKVLRGATVHSAEVHEGSLHILGGSLSAGKMNHTSARLTVGDSGHASAVTVSDGIMDIYTGTATNIKIEKGAVVLNDPGSVLEYSCITGSYGYIGASKGLLSSCHVNSGTAEISTSCNVIALNVSSGACVE